MNELFVIGAIFVATVAAFIIILRVGSYRKHAKLIRLKETGIVYDAVIERYDSKRMNNVPLVFAVCSYVDKNSEKRFVRSELFSVNDPANYPHKVDVRVYVDPFNPRDYAVEFIPKEE